jgi:hypothetical protein
MPRVCYITQGRERRVDVSYFEVYHIGVGFVVARSNVLGNAKASGRGTSNKYESCAFLYIYTNGTIGDSWAVKERITECR